MGSSRRGKRTAAERPYCENTAFVAFVHRILRALGRRAGADIETLSAIGALTSEIDAIAVDAIVGARADGWSWTEIAKRLGITRQAAHQRYGARVAARQAELDAARAAKAAAEAEAAELIDLEPVAPVDLTGGFFLSA